MEKNELIAEDNKLLTDYIEKTCLSHPDNFGIELIIRPECNQKCEYCYITKFGDKIFPPHLRVDNNTILQNIESLLDYLYSKQYFITQWDIFAGDIFYDGLIFDVLDKIYNYFNKIRLNYSSYYMNHLYYHNHHEIFGHIMMPCNMSFCHKKDLIEKYQTMRNKLFEIYIGWDLSYSSDGPYGNARKGEQLDEEFYQNVFEIIKKDQIGMHPMISAENIDYQIDNYKWWREAYQKYGLLQMYREIEPGFLEVRNDGWTQDKIDKYLEFLKYMINQRFKDCHNDIDIMTKQLFGTEEIKQNNNLIPCIGVPLDPIHIITMSDDCSDMSCTIGSSLVIRCNDLGIVPCHRTAYPWMTGGHFVLNENHEIIGIEAEENINGYLNIVLSNALYKPKCFSCWNRRMCIKGCFGAQMEATGDYNIPIPSVCDLLMQKTKLLMKTYKDMKILDHLFFDIPEITTKDTLLIIATYQKEVENDERYYNSIINN